jgi:hypothetical protein
MVTGVTGDRGSFDRGKNGARDVWPLRRGGRLVPVERFKTLIAGFAKAR